MHFEVPTIRIYVEYLPVTITGFFNKTKSFKGAV